MDIHHIILYPVVTEKSSNLNALKKYTVVVHPDATKIGIRQAVEHIYNTKISSVQIIRSHSKSRVVARGRNVIKRQEMKKAIITLKKGEKPIDFIKTKKKK